jgi:hypothetical protein
MRVCASSSLRSLIRSPVQSIASCSSADLLVAQKELTRQARSSSRSVPSARIEPNSVCRVCPSGARRSVGDAADRMLTGRGVLPTSGCRGRCRPRADARGACCVKLSSGGPASVTDAPQLLFDELIGPAHALRFEVKLARPARRAAVMHQLGVKTLAAMLGERAVPGPLSEVVLGEPRAQFAFDALLAPPGLPRILGRHDTAACHPDVARRPWRGERPGLRPRRQRIAGHWTRGAAGAARRFARSDRPRAF